MGLQNQLTDVSSESLPIILLSLIATGVCYLRSLIAVVLRSLRISRRRSDDANDAVLLLADHLHANRVLSYEYTPDPVDYQCIVCLNDFADGERVRKLVCQHVFHEDCFDGWIRHLNFSCPLCRSPVVFNERVVRTRRRVVDDVMDWFGFR